MVAVAALVAALTALVLRRRLRGPAVFFLLAGSGAALAGGGMMLRPDPSVGEWVLALAGMALLAPLHARIVLGPLGRRR